MNATTQPATAIVMVEKFVDWAISSQAGQEWAEGSTTSESNPDRMESPRARSSMPYSKPVIGVYYILHDATGSAYVGGSKSVMKRIATHKRELRQGAHRNSNLQRIHDEYGMDSLRFEIVERCGADALKDREQAHIDGAAFHLVNKSLTVYAISDGSKQSATMRKKWASFDHGTREAIGAKISTSVKERYADDAEYLAGNAVRLAEARSCDAFKANHQSPEANRKRSAATRQHWQDADIAADRVKRIKAGMASVANIANSCKHCGTDFVGPKRQKWCGPKCRVAGFYASHPGYRKC